MSFELVSLWVRTDVEKPVMGKMRVTLITPAGENVPLGENSLDLVAYARLRYRIGFQGIQINQPGMHFFQVALSINDSEEYNIVAEMPLEVTLSKTLDVKTLLGDLRHNP